MKSMFGGCTMNKESNVLVFFPPALLDCSPWTSQDFSVFFVWAGPALWLHRGYFFGCTCLYLTRFVRHPHLLLLQLDSYLTRFAEFFVRHPHFLPQLFWHLTFLRHLGSFVFEVFRQRLRPALPTGLHKVLTRIYSLHIDIMRERCRKN